MAYATYITNALVCGSKNNNTSDRSYLLFTRDAGMVWASAKSAREERSKHRYALQEFSTARVSLVRGKTGWRVTGAEPLTNLYFTSTDRSARTTLRNTIRLLRRFVQGESPHPDIFDDIITTLDSTGDADQTLLETVLSLRILSRLGYIAPSAVYRSLLDAPSALEAHQGLSSEQQTSCEAAIKNALAVSHL